MSEKRVAQRYAKSLLELAHEQKVLEEVHSDMQLFKQTVDENRDLLLALKSPILTQIKKKEILNAIFKDVNKLTNSFFEIIAQKNRAEVLPAIAEEFHRQYNQLKGIQVAQITTATPLDDKMRNEFISIIKKISDKKEIQLKEEVNEDIIGGFVLTVGDRQIDDTIKSKLALLKRDLTKNQYVKEF